MSFPITLSETATQKAYELISRENRQDLRLRVQVQPGGCSGLIYQLFWDSTLYDEDLTEDFGEVEVVVDKMSAPYLEGSVISYEDSLQKQGFEINNPNAEGTCACGDSFH